MAETHTAPFMVVCDLEATCWEDGQSQSVATMEVIEIGCVLVASNGGIQDEFSTFVQPQVNKLLSLFCTKLTGITQNDVDSAPAFDGAMALLDSWVADRCRLWGSWGNFDHKLLVDQAQRHGKRFHFTSLQHINLKKAWRRTTKQRRQNGLQAALQFHALDFVGSPHRGIDDARNTARLLEFIPHHEIMLQLTEGYNDQVNQ